MNSKQSSSSLSPLITAESLPSFWARRTFGAILTRDYSGQNQVLKGSRPDCLPCSWHGSIHPAPCLGSECLGSIGAPAASLTHTCSHLLCIQRDDDGQYQTQRGKRDFCSICCLLDAVEGSTGSTCLCAGTELTCAHHEEPFPS